MKKIIKKIVTRLLKILGFRLQRVNSIPKRNSIKDQGLRDCLFLLKSLGFTPKRIFDIGAHKGGWTRLVKEFYPHSNYTLFEPQKRLTNYVTDLIADEKVELINKGVGSKSEFRKFTFVEREDSCNFLISKSEAKDKNFEQIDLEVVTLDSFIELKKVPAPDLLKIDAEGLDIEVLKGAKSIIGVTEVIMIEAGVLNSIIPNNIAVVINYMKENGYELFDITELNRPFEVKLLWLMELVFVLKSGNIYTRAKSL